MKREDYTRIPIRSYGIMGAHTLWLADDHILKASVLGYQERYKRFYFADIQALIIQETVTGFAINVLFGILLFFGLLAWLVAREGPFGTFWMIVCLASALGLIINAAFGTTCRTTIQTAVQTDTLPAARRLKKALRLQDILSEKVLAVQKEETPQGPAPWTPPSSPASHGPAETPTSDTLFAEPAPAVPTVRHSRARFHRAAFACLFVSGFVHLSAFAVHNLAILVLGLFAYLGSTGFLIVSLLRQRGSDLPASLGNLTWTAVGLSTVGWVVSFATGLAMAFQNPEWAGQNQWRLYMEIAKLNMTDHLPLVITYAYDALVGLGMGIPGLVMVRRHRARSSALKGTAS